MRRIYPKNTPILYYEIRKKYFSAGNIKFLSKYLENISCFYTLASEMSVNELLLTKVRDYLW